MTGAPFGGQTGIVTGAARGIGLAISRRLAGAGLHTVMADIDEAAVSESARVLADEGLSVEAVALDVTASEQIESTVAGVLERRAQIHVLVNNAGIYPYVPFTELDLDTWRRFQQTNVESAFLCTRGVLPTMRHHGYGRIVNFASGVFFNGVGGAAYVTSKAAAIGLTRSLALELGPHGITVNAVAPGLVETEGIRSLGDRADALFAATVPDQIVQRRGRPDDIAEAVAYMSSPAAGFLTGQTINVDGGARFN